MTRRKIKDLDLWEKVKRTAKPLHSNRAAPSGKPDIHLQSEAPEPVTKHAPKRIIRPHTNEPLISISPQFEPKLLDQSTRRKISKGKLTIEAKLDLHGMTQIQAHQRLLGFLERAYNTGRRTILVITGKGAGGEGILRSAVPRWLDEPAFRKYSAGYHEASLSHGGSGALYVRVRRKKAG
ncbi:MAG: Smr/MutS family protein [Pseudomonadota bacterium]